MLAKLKEALKQQRLARSSAVIVSLILVLVVHAPVIPVVTGCVLALAVSVFRAWPRGADDVSIEAGR